MPQTTTLTITLNIVDALGIQTNSLPDAIVGQPYQLQCQLVGGTPPYFWSASGLPVGLNMSVSGLISGTPLTSGSGIDVLLVVNDSSNN